MRPGRLGDWGLSYARHGKGAVQHRDYKYCNACFRNGRRDDDRRLTAEILNPKLAVFYYYRATVHFYMDRYDDAITDYDLAIRLRRNYADAYYNRGLAFNGKGLLRHALTDLNKALTCNAFAIPASPWTSEARAKISEIESKLSATGNLQAQTMDVGAEITVVK